MDGTLNPLKFASRVKELARLENERDAGERIDCLLITSSPNLVYFFDYPGLSFERFSCGLIPLDGEETALVVPKLDEPKARRSAASNVFAWADGDGYEAALESALSSVGVGRSRRRFGCEDTITLGFMDSIRRLREGASFESVSDEIGKLRMIKDDDEIEATRGVARKLAKGFEGMPNILSPEKRESDVMFELKRFLRDQGLSEVDFCAVQSGPNSAVPHLETTERKLRPGDIVVVDISCVDDSRYFADFTRTYVVGSPSPEQREVYDLVREAQSRGIESAKKGNPAEQVDGAARGVIEKAGYGKYFFHRTGHGLGLEVHERPWINSGNAAPLEAGMVFTVEPGVYLDGRFGVRIEDNIIIGDSGSEDITALSHDLVQV